jgi:hypothetical protein
MSNEIVEAFVDEAVQEGTCVIQPSDAPCTIVYAGPLKDVKKKFGLVPSGYTVRISRKDFEELKAHIGSKG